MTEIARDLGGPDGGPHPKHVCNLCGAESADPAVTERMRRWEPCWMGPPGSKCAPVRDTEPAPALPSAAPTAPELPETS